MHMINDDELLLYYYRELDAGERARIATAIAEDPHLAQRLHSLVARLDAAAALPEVPVPPHVRQRWQDALDQAAAGSHSRREARPLFSQPRWQLAAAAAVVLALVVTFEALRSTSPPETQPTVASTNEPAGDTAATAYENGLRFHLASTERRLAGLDNASPEERARMIDVIIGQNRLYALAAERAGEPQLARVLRAFNPILEDVAKGRGESTAANLSQLNFELRVMQARLSADAAAPSNTL
jgi:hypothetical protein